MRATSYIGCIYIYIYTGASARSVEVVSRRGGRERRREDGGGGGRVEGGNGVGGRESGKGKGANIHINTGVSRKCV